MSRDKQNIKATDWLTKGIPKEQLEREKREAIKEAEAELHNKQIEEMCAIMADTSYLACEDAPLVPESAGICDKVSCHRCKEARLLMNAGYRKASDLAEEIFAEIERMCIDTFGNFNHRVFAELKKKYIGKDINVTTNKEEGK